MTEGKNNDLLERIINRCAYQLAVDPLKLLKEAGDEISRLRSELAREKQINQELRDKIEKLQSDIGWRQSADWARRSGGTL